MNRLIKNKRLLFTAFGIFFILFISYRIFINIFQEYEDLSQSTTINILSDETYKFKSLKSNKTNVRQGPSLGHDILWTYQKRNLPVEVLEDIQGWSRIRDYEAKTGWIKNTLISSNRTAIVTPWHIPDKNSHFSEIYQNNDKKQLEMRLQSGVIIKIIECDGALCKLKVSDREGWINQDLIFGVYQGEIISKSD